MFLNSYIFILLILGVVIFGDIQSRNHTTPMDENGISNLSEYSEKNSSYTPTLNHTNEFPTSELEEYEHTNDEESWADWIFQLVRRFPGTITCIVVICVVFCAFSSLQCILGMTECQE